MRLKALGLLVFGALGLTFVLTVGTPAAPKAKAVSVTANAEAAGVPTANPAEPHPQIREAIAALRRAKEHMEHAAHDFGGHRVEAIRATDEAIRQLEECLRYDKN
jgi:methionine aminopeptidase